MIPADPLPATVASAGRPPRTALGARGSIVMGDDGAGAAALSALEAGWELPEEIDRLDLGTPGPYFAELVRGYEALVVLDALRTPGTPGSVRSFTEDELRLVPAGPRLTPHVLDLGEALAALDFEGCRPQSVFVVGVVPERVRAGTELSDSVAAAIPEMAEKIALALTRLGHRVERRAEPIAAPSWWRAAGEARSRDRDPATGGASRPAGAIEITDGRSPLPDRSFHGT